VGKGVRDVHGGVFGAPKLLRHGWSVDVRHGALLNVFNSVFKLHNCAITVLVVGVGELSKAISCRFSSVLLAVFLTFTKFRKRDSTISDMV
jgi:hypothetical protein